MSTADMAFVGGTTGNNDIRATTDVDGTILSGGGGDDILRGGRFDDILVGGEGNDRMFGGAGADQFRFFFDQVSGTDTDFVYDLNFTDGDSMVFGNFADGTFVDIPSAEVNGFDDGTAAIVSAYAGLAALVNGADDNWTATQKGSTQVLILSYTDGVSTQTIHISNAWDQVSAFLIPDIIEA